MKKLKFVERLKQKKKKKAPIIKSKTISDFFFPDLEDDSHCSAHACNNFESQLFRTFTTKNLSKDDSHVLKKYIEQNVEGGKEIRLPIWKKLIEKISLELSTAQKFKKNASKKDMNYFSSETLKKTDKLS